MTIGPGGETFSPTRLQVDSADRLVNDTRRSGGDICEANRPVHGAGLVVTGHFVASGNMAPWCRTACLTVGRSTATVRFSNLRKRDRHPDDKRTWNHGADLRGMACRLVNVERVDGEETGTAMDLVALSVPRFLVRRQEDFHYLSRGKGLPGTLGRLALMVVTRRTTATAALVSFIWSSRIRYAPWRGLAGHRYFGVHTFWLETGGERRAARYHWRPVDPGRRHLRLPLDRMLCEQLAGDGSIAFDLVFDLFDDPVPYRKTNDPLRRYPSVLREFPGIRSLRRWEGSTRVVAGRLTLEDYHQPKHHPAAERWVFNPVPTVGGFEPSDDEILLARGGAYMASHARRRSHANAGAEG